MALSVVLTAAQGEGWAAKLPDWAREIAASAPEVPEGIPDHGARVLFRERRVSYDGDGTRRTRVRIARQILSNRREIGLHYFPFSGNTKIVFSRAWHVSPQGRTTRSSKANFIDLTISDAFLTDSKARVIPIPDVARGSLLFFEFRSRGVPFSLSFSELFLEPFPADRLTLAVELPQGWSLRHQWLRHAGEAPRIDGEIHRWTLRDVEPIEEEEVGPSAAESAPLLAVGVFPPEGAAVSPAAFRDWAALSAWYEELARGRGNATPEILTLAAEIGGGPRPDTLAAYARFVRDKVRYLNREVGIGGLQPRSAAETLASRYGDCKAKATLLGAMLSTQELPSHPVLVSATRSDTVAEAVPTLDAFDHMILAVAVPEEHEAPGPPHAVTRVEGLGPLMLVDATNEFVSFGWIPSALEGKRALLAVAGDGRLIEIPHQGPSAHTARSEIEITLDPSGSIESSVRTAYHGEPAANRRMLYRASSRDYREAWQRRLRRELATAEVGTFAVELEDPGGALVETVRWSSPQSAGEGSARRGPLFPGVGPFMPRPTLRRRETAVRFDHHWTVELESKVSGLASNAGLPEPLDANGDGWSIRADFDRRDRVLIGRATVVLERKQFPRTAFRDLRRFFSNLERALGASTWLFEP